MLDSVYAQVPLKKMHEFQISRFLLQVYHCLNKKFKMKKK